MPRFILTLMVLFCISFSVLAGEVDCSAAGVDQADSPNFAQKLAKCESEKPIELWDPASKKGFLQKQGEVVKTYEAYDDKNKSDEPTLKEQIVIPTTGDNPGRHFPGTTFQIRQFFRMDSDVGPVAAVTVIADMTKQMASYCSEGWEKGKEWTERSGSGYFLYYQFTCNGEPQN